MLSVLKIWPSLSSPWGLDLDCSIRAGSCVNLIMEKSRPFIMAVINSLFHHMEDASFQLCSIVEGVCGLWANQVRDFKELKSLILGFYLESNSDFFDYSSSLLVTHNVTFHCDDFFTLVRTFSTRICQGIASNVSELAGVVSDAPKGVVVVNGWTDGRSLITCLRRSNGPLQWTWVLRLGWGPRSVPLNSFPSHESMRMAFSRGWSKSEGTESMTRKS